jgi:dynactin complex subunit
MKNPFSRKAAVAEIDLNEKLSHARAALADAETELGRVRESDEDETEAYNTLQNAIKEVNSLNAQIKFRSSAAGAAEIQAQSKAEAVKQKALDAYLTDLNILGREVDRVFEDLEKVSHQLSDLFSRSGEHNNQDLMHQIWTAKLHFKSYLLFKAAGMTGKDAILENMYTGKRYSDYLPKS